MDVQHSKRVLTGASGSPKHLNNPVFYGAIRKSCRNSLIRSMVTWLEGHFEKERTMKFSTFMVAVIAGVLMLAAPASASAYEAYGYVFDGHDDDEKKAKHKKMKHKDGMKAAKAKCKMAKKNAEGKSDKAKEDAKAKCHEAMEMAGKMKGKGHKKGHDKHDKTMKMMKDKKEKSEHHNKDHEEEHEEDEPSK